MRLQTCSRVHRAATTRLSSFGFTVGCMFVTPGCSRGELVVSVRSHAAMVTVTAPSATARTDVSALMAHERCIRRTTGGLARALLLAGAMNSSRTNEHDLWLERIAAA